MKTPIYMDYQATTPLDPRALGAMMPYLTEKFGNPHSTTHKFGWESEAALDIAREQVADVIRSNPEEVIFTSGATEANNLAIKGTFGAIGQQRPEIVTLASEHKCVLETAKACAPLGAEVKILPVKSDGLIDIDELHQVITERTAIISVMAVNNEIGVIQPLEAIGKIAKEVGAFFHTDAAQAFGKTPLDVDRMKIDLLSISGHKIYGPKGVGALYVRKGTKLAQHMHGGAQEGGYRAGTQAPALVAGLGKAAELAAEEMLQEQGRLSTLMQRLLDALSKNIDDLKVNGSTESRIPGNLNISIGGVDNSLFLSKVRKLALSSGSACASGNADPSHVLMAIGCDKERMQSAIRLGIGRFTSDEEIDFAASEIVAAVNEIKKG